MRENDLLKGLLAEANKKGPTYWEDRFTTWAKGPSDTEKEECVRVERQIRKAIDQNPKLSDKTRVITKGSHKNNTNTRRGGDVDVAVILINSFWARYPEGMTAKDFNHGPAEMPFADFKELVHTALIDYFGASSVTVGDKSFKIDGNTYHVHADVVPAFERRFYFKTSGKVHLQTGMAFDSSDGLILNYPDQDFDNGKAKNVATSKMYKRVIRILKRMRDNMQEEKVAGAADVASYLIECLVYNAPNELFDRPTYHATVRAVLAHCWNETREGKGGEDWYEINGIKTLFNTKQPWTMTQANTFLQACWDYVGYE